MKFGIFYELSVPRPFGGGIEKQVYDNALEQIRVADEVGFDTVWAVEHHFLEEYSHCSAPELFLPRPVTGNRSGASASIGGAFGTAIRWAAPSTTRWRR